MHESVGQLTKTLEQLGHSRKTGTLLVTMEGNKKAVICLADGQIVYLFLLGRTGEEAVERFMAALRAGEPVGSIRFSEGPPMNRHPGTPDLSTLLGLLRGPDPGQATASGVTGPVRQAARPGVPLTEEMRPAIREVCARYFPDRPADELCDALFKDLAVLRQVFSRLGEMSGSEETAQKIKQDLRQALRSVLDQYYIVRS